MIAFVYVYVCIFIDIASLAAFASVGCIVYLEVKVMGDAGTDVGCRSGFRVPEVLHQWPILRADASYLLRCSSCGVHAWARSAHTHKTRVVRYGNTDEKRSPILVTFLEPLSIYGLYVLLGS